MLLVLLGRDTLGANLSGADLGAAKLQGAKLQGAKLQGAIGLTQEQIDQAQGDEETALPNGLQRPDSWTVQTHEQPLDG
jgi:uncharacterized protein YjbI with pentapeptide repeats